MLDALSNLGQAVKSDAYGLAGNIAKASLLFYETHETTRYEEVSSDKAADAIKKGEKLLKGTTIITQVKEPKRFVVQFNPSSLRISCRGGGRAMVANYDNLEESKAGVYQFKALDPYMVVSFTILFDALNLADAFMEERFTIGATTLAKNVATAAVGKEYTVRPQVEGFLAAIRNENHRMMQFVWGELSYMGVLSDVSARYTMFNTAGNPIRAEVQVNMMMGGTEPKGKCCLKDWRDRYKRIVEKKAVMNGEKAESITTGNIKNQVNNLLNL